MTINIDGHLSTAGSFGIDPPDPCNCDFAPAGHTEDECAPTCFRCNGRQSWQLHDGSVEECPACTAEPEDDPDACSRCDQVEDVPLSYAGLCQSCDYDEGLRWGYIPSYLGVRTGPR